MDDADTAAAPERHRPTELRTQVEAYLHEHIPISAGMGIRVEALEPDLGPEPLGTDGGLPLYGGHQATAFAVRGGGMAGRTPAD